MPNWKDIVIKSRPIVGFLANIYILLVGLYFTFADDEDEGTLPIQSKDTFWVHLSSALVSVLDDISLILYIATLRRQGNDILSSFKSNISFLYSRGKTLSIEEKINYMQAIQRFPLNDVSKGELCRILSIQDDQHLEPRISTSRFKKLLESITPCKKVYVIKKLQTELVLLLAEKDHTMVTEGPLEQAIYHFSGTNSLEIYTIISSLRDPYLATGKLLADRVLPLFTSAPVDTRHTTSSGDTLYDGEDWILRMHKTLGKLSTAAIVQDIVSVIYCLTALLELGMISSVGYNSFRSCDMPAPISDRGLGVGGFFGAVFNLFAVFSSSKLPASYDTTDLSTTTFHRIREGQIKFAAEQTARVAEHEARVDAETARVDAEDALLRLAINTGWRTWIEQDENQHLRIAQTSTFLQREAIVNRVQFLSDFNAISEGTTDSELQDLGYVMLDETFHGLALEIQEEFTYQETPPYLETAQH